MPAGERNLMLLFLVLAVGAIVFALPLQLPEARLFPLITGVVTTCLILLYFLITAVPTLRRRLAVYVEDEVFLRIAGVADALEEEEAEEAAERVHPPNHLPDEIRHSRERVIISLLAAFGVLGLVAGLTVAVPAFMLAVMIGYSRRPWPLTLAVTVGTALFIYLVFSVVLRLPPHLGLLGELL